MTTPIQTGSLPAAQNIADKKTLLPSAQPKPVLSPTLPKPLTPAQQDFAKLDPQTQTAIEKMRVGDSDYYQHKWSKGEDVKYVQRRINEFAESHPDLKLKSIKDDGIYGDATKAAVKKIQRYYNEYREKNAPAIARDGTVGQETIALLEGKGDILKNLDTSRGYVSTTHPFSKHQIGAPVNLPTQVGLFTGSERSQRLFNQLVFQALENPGQFAAQNPELVKCLPMGKPVHGRVTSEFGERSDREIYFGLPESKRELYSKERRELYESGGDSTSFHHAIDIGGGDKPVKAPGNGIVENVFKTGQGAKTVVINHGFGIRTLYTHLGEVNVLPGQHLNRGDEFAKSGNSGGISTGPHTHYEVLLGEPKGGDSILPSADISGIARVDPAVTFKFPEG